LFGDDNNMYKTLYGYKIFSDGRVFSKYSNKYLKHDITKNGYEQVTLFNNGEKIRKKVHRLVAYLFCNPPENYKELTVNHKDGNKSNNDYKNLEWCTCMYNNRHARETGLNNISQSNSDRWKDIRWREKTCKRFSEVRVANESFKGKKNPRFRYLITDENGKKYLINELALLIKLSYSATYKRVKMALLGNVVKEFLEYKITVTDIKSQ
jgi:hypothetical protein